MKKIDSYGFKKLWTEQVFQSFFSNKPNQETSTKFLSLRLADVIGPFDESFRFWKYVLWAQEVQN